MSETPNKIKYAVGALVLCLLKDTFELARVRTVSPDGNPTAVFLLDKGYALYSLKEGDIKLPTEEDLMKHCLNKDRYVFTKDNIPTELLPLEFQGRPALVELYSQESGMTSVKIVGLTGEVKSFVISDEYLTLPEVVDKPYPPKIYPKDTWILTERESIVDPGKLIYRTSKVEHYIPNPKGYGMGHYSVANYNGQDSYLAEEGKSLLYMDGGKGDEIGYTPLSEMRNSTTTNYTPTTLYSDCYFVEYGKDVLWHKRMSDTEIERAKKCLPFTSQEVNNKEAMIFTILPENTSYRKITKNPAMCAFVATQKFISSNLGKALSAEDESWYKSHPLIVAGGLPEEYTLTVLNDLVKPYGLGIKRVFYPKNSSFFEETKKWVKVLGINPVASQARNVSNEEFFKIPGMAEVYDNDPTQFAFETTDSLPQGIPIIVMNGGIVSANTAGGGHASYHGPRAQLGNHWKIAVTYDKIENCNRFEEAPTFNALIEEAQELDITACKDDNGTRLSTSVFSYSHSSGQYSGYSGSKYYSDHEVYGSGYNSRYKDGTEDIVPFDAGSGGQGSVPGHDPFYFAYKNAKVFTGFKSMKSRSPEFRAISRGYKHFLDSIGIDISKAIPEKNNEFSLNTTKNNVSCAKNDLLYFFKLHVKPVLDKYSITAEEFNITDCICDAIVSEAHIEDCLTDSISLIEELRKKLLAIIGQYGWLSLYGGLCLYYKNVNISEENSFEEMMLNDIIICLEEIAANRMLSLV